MNDQLLDSTFGASDIARKYLTTLIPGALRKSQKDLLYRYPVGVFDLGWVVGFQNGQVWEEEGQELSDPK